MGHDSCFLCTAEKTEGRGLSTAPPGAPFRGHGWLPGKRKKPAASYSRTGESRTTLGDGALDFRVRDGNGYDCPSVATGKGDELEAKEDCSAREAGTESRFMMKLEK